MLKLRRPAKTSRISSKPLLTEREERREPSRPEGAISSLSKDRPRGYSRVVTEDPDTIVDHRPSAYLDCGVMLSPDLSAETISAYR